ncbi:MAG: hypothetical protein D3910_00750 [Candidatus Electrothrix sp. ATG2]|nr:hypothetical protein [Candidatus Electrothrix sp. ATG2]
MDGKPLWGNTFYSDWQYIRRKLNLAVSTEFVIVRERRRENVPSELKSTAFALLKTMALTKPPENTPRA